MNNQFLVIILFLSFISCQETTNTQYETNNYSKTIFPKDTTQLWLGEGNIKSDTVLILCEGGPATMINFDIDGKSIWRYLPDYRNYYKVFVHQAQTYNRTMFDFKRQFTLKDAQTEVDNTIEMLNQAIQYFKSRNKTVIVIGHSYGAFVILGYLTQKEEMADKYILSAVRLNPHPKQVAYHLKGFNEGFEADGKTFIEPDTTNDEHIRHQNERYWKIYRVKQLLKGAFGKINYTEMLNDKDLSKVHVAYGKFDQNIGALTSSELDFLQSKNVPVLAIEGGHYDVWKRVIDAVHEKSIIL